MHYAYFEAKTNTVHILPEESKQYGTPIGRTEELPSNPHFFAAVLLKNAKIPVSGLTVTVHELPSTE